MNKINTFLLYDSLMIAIESGNIIMSFYNNNDFCIKSDNSPITKADIESNLYITKRLQEISDYKVCSEEAVLDYNERCDLEYYWLIDPLDGTKDFLAKNGNFTINIALIYKNNPILGIVYAPCLHEMYFALKDFGAFSYNISILESIIKDKNITTEWLDINKIALNECNMTKIYGEKLESLKLIDKHIHDCLVNNLQTTTSDNIKIIACDSIFHSSNETKEFINKYNLLTLRRGSSLKVCSVASSLANIYPRLNGTSEWDTAASDIILRETGGIIIDINTKKPMIYNKENIKNNHFIAFSKNQLFKKIYNDIV